MTAVLDWDGWFEAIFDAPDLDATTRLAALSIGLRSTGRAVLGHVERDAGLSVPSASAAIARLVDRGWLRPVGGALAPALPTEVGFPDAGAVR